MYIVHTLYQYKDITASDKYETYFLDEEEYFCPECDQYFKWWAVKLVRDKASHKYMPDARV